MGNRPAVFFLPKTLRRVNIKRKGKTRNIRERVSHVVALTRGIPSRVRVSDLPSILYVRFSHLWVIVRARRKYR